MTHGYIFHTPWWLNLGPQVWSSCLWPNIFGIPKKGANNPNTLKYEQISCPLPYNISQFLSQPASQKLPDILTCGTSAKGQLALMDQESTSYAKWTFQKSLEVWHFPFPGWFSFWLGYFATSYYLSRSETLLESWLILPIPSNIFGKSTWSVWISSYFRNDQIPEMSGRFQSDQKWMRECKKANGITICKISHVLVQSHLGTIPLTKPHWEGFRFYSQRRQEWTRLTPRSGPPRDIIGKWLQKSCRNWSSRHLSP